MHFSSKWMIKKNSAGFSPTLFFTRSYSSIVQYMKYL